VLRAVDVLGAGAGPAGSATAAFLARAGYRVLLADRAQFPRDKAWSDYMSPEAVRLLDRLGVVADLEADGAVPLRGTVVTAARGARLEGRFDLAGHRPFRPTGLSISRRLLDHRLVLAARQGGAELWERTTVEELLYDGGAVAGAVLRGPGGRSTVRARLTVGAEGLRSVVARRLGPRRHLPPTRVAFVAHLEGVEGMEQSAELFVGAAGYVGLNPIGGGRTNVALVVPRARAAAARGRAEQFFLETVGTFASVARRIERAGLVRPVLATGPFSAWAGRVTADGAALVGDAADFFDPFTGEGIYSALRGAELLAQAAIPPLERPGIVSHSDLAAYRRTRRRNFAGKWAVERLIGYGMLWPRLFDRAVARLQRHGLAHTLIGVTGDFVPARAVLNPSFLARMLV
jgi:flavin-dependent dehydrogenase